MRIGNRIKSFRRTRGMTQDAFAYQVGVTQATVSRWERGIEAPNLSVLGIIESMIGKETNPLQQYVKDFPGIAAALNKNGEYVALSDVTEHMRAIGGLVVDAYGLDSRRDWVSEDWSYIDSQGGFNAFFKKEESGVYVRKGAVSGVMQIASVSFSILDGEKVLISTSVYIENPSAIYPYDRKR